MNTDKFQYTYSATQQTEVEKIRKKYSPEKASENKLERLRKLDKSVEAPGSIIALTLGITGTLVFGLGLCFVLIDARYLSGILIGIAGMATVLPAYPVYKKITNHRRKKFASEILRLADETGK